MSYSSGDGYNACNGDGLYNSYNRYSTGSIGSTVKPFGSGLYSRSDINGRPVRKIPSQNRNVKASGNDSDSSCESEYISSRNDSCHPGSPILSAETPPAGGQDRRDSIQDDGSDRSRSERSVEPPTRTPSPGSCIRNVSNIFIFFYNFFKTT